MSRKYRIASLGISVFFALTMISSFALPLDYQPAGWLKAGSHPQEYETGVDKKVFHDGKSSAYIKSAKDKPEGFSTLMQSFSAEKYIGKRIRFAAYVKTEGVEGWAGLWMRVDTRTRQAASFDNMMNRKIHGTLDWKWYEVVLDVPDESVNIALGILLQGRGKAWIDSIKFEVVPKSVPITNLHKKKDEPQNLGFED